MPTLLSWLKVPVEARLSVKGAPDVWYELPAALRPWPKRATIVVKAGGTGLAKRASKIVALQASGEMIFRRSLVEPVLGSLPEVVLRPAALASATGAVVDNDFVLVGVVAQAPLDRQASTVVWTRPKAPSASHLKRLQAAAWGEGRKPRERIFRIGETANEIAADEELAARLQTATKGFFGVRAVTPVELAQRSVFTVHPDYAPDYTEDAKVSAAAESAYWKLVTGGAASRADVCKSPIWAYWLGRLDGKPRPDTRKAAMSHPVTAAFYALTVDGKPSKEAERATAAHETSAFLYAQRVARSIPKSLAPIITKAGWDVDEEESRIRELWRFAK